MSTTYKRPDGTPDPHNTVCNCNGGDQVLVWSQREDMYVCPTYLAMSNELFGAPVEAQAAEPATTKEPLVRRPITPMGTASRFIA